MFPVYLNGPPERFKQLSGDKNDGDDVDQNLPPVDLHEAKCKRGPEIQKRRY